MNRALVQFDRTLIHFLQRAFEPMARISLFVISFWFGALKVFAESPVNALVEALLHGILPGIPFPVFNLFFGIYEMTIGVLILIPRLERPVVALSLFHLATTLLPLVLLTELTWEGPFNPSLLGQYILKNLAIISLTIGVAARLAPIGGGGESRK